MASNPSSSRARPAKIFPDWTRREPISSRMRGIRSGRAEWKVSAERILPIPTTIIFVRPLWTGPEKQVWSLIRLRMRTPAESKQWRSIQTSPESTEPTLTHSMLERISRPVAAKVRPRDSTIFCWPVAVAPLWEPMEGTRKGLAPCIRSQSPTALVMGTRLEIPRLPAVMATSPCGGSLPIWSRARWTALGTS